MGLLLSQQACADLLGVSRRTVRYWDRGRSRVPWSAVRLMRLLRGGEVPASGFDGWRVLNGGRLVTPAGIEFCTAEFEWWALTCLQARSWQRRFDRAQSRLSAGEPPHAAVPVVDARSSTQVVTAPRAASGDLANADPVTPHPDDAFSASGLPVGLAAFARQSDAACTDGGCGVAVHLQQVPACRLAAPIAMGGFSPVQPLQRGASDRFRLLPVGPNSNTGQKGAIDG